MTTLLHQPLIARCTTKEARAAMASYLKRVRERCSKAGKAAAETLRKEKKFA